MADGSFQIKEDDIDQLAERAYFVRDGFLDGEEVRRMKEDLAALTERGELTDARIHREASCSDDAAATRARGDATTWLEDLEAPGAFAELHSRFDSLGDQLNRRAFLGLQHFDLQLARYPGDGAGYDRHLDASRGKQRRLLTAIVYLNPDWVPSDGGQLQIFLENGTTRRIAPRGGRLMVFLADVVEHAVLPSFETRFAATAWYRKRAGFRVSL